jgi:hypothetical protein
MPGGLMFLYRNESMRVIPRFARDDSSQWDLEAV